jgi:tRNA G18 (ribose-2'-O)-methylase SpoU
MRDNAGKLSTQELRQSKAGRGDFVKLARRPIVVVLDGVKRPYNLGALFRLCDAMLVERLVICGVTVNLTNRKLIQAGRGTQRWVPWDHAEDAVAVVQGLKRSGFTIVVAEQAQQAIAPENLVIAYPVCLVLGSEADGVSESVLALADIVTAIPMLGMANSLNVATSAAILLYWLCRPPLTAASDHDRAT